MNMPERKPRIATVWLGGCSGCHMSFLDLDERLIDLAQMADVVFTPIADTKIFPEDVDVTLVEGAIANEDHLEMLHTVRARTRVLAALGDCAITGNVTALRNVWPLDVVLQTSYGAHPFGGLDSLCDRGRDQCDFVHECRLYRACNPTLTKARLIRESLMFA